MKAWGYVLAAFLVGGLAPIQGSLNGQMGRFLGHPLRGTLMNFAVGGIVLLVILLLFVGLPQWSKLSEAPIMLFSPGLMGILFVTTLLALIPEIGALRVLAAVIVGQLIVSAVIDHYGLLSVPVHAFGTSRFLGTLLLIGGLYLIQRS